MSIFCTFSSFLDGHWVAIRITQMSRIIMSSLFLTDDGLFLYGDDIKMSVSSLSRARHMCEPQRRRQKDAKGWKKMSHSECWLRRRPLWRMSPARGPSSRCIRALKAASFRPEKITAPSLIKIFSLNNRQFGETHS